MLASASESPRPIRIPFERPVRVVPEGQGAIRLFAGNLSKQGMFLRAAEAPDIGTRVSLALEAKGKALPFAEGEVVWKSAPGFGVRFVEFSNPRSPELVDELIRRYATAAVPAPPGLARRKPNRLPLALAGVVGLGGIGFALWPRAAVEEAPAAESSLASPAELAPEPPAIEVLDPTPVEQPVVLAASLELPRSAASSIRVEPLADGLRVELSLEEGAVIEHAFALNAPPRLVMDVRGAAPQRSWGMPLTTVENVERVRVGRLGEGTRVVVDVRRAIAGVSREGNAVRVRW